MGEMAKTVADRPELASASGRETRALRLGLLGLLAAHLVVALAPVTGALVRGVLLASAAALAALALIAGRLGRALRPASAEQDAAHDSGQAEREQRLEEELVHQALHDALTGMPNRALLLNRLHLALRRRDGDHTLVALLCLDIDRFKAVNDTLGHELGDALLMAVGARLQASARPADTVAHLGGDRFVILLAPCPATDDAAALAHELRTALQRPFHIDGREVFVSSSIGVALTAPGPGRKRDLLRDAEFALYRAKEQGPGAVEVFSEQRAERARRQMTLETELRRALEYEEFSLRYQPVVSLADEGLIAVEALVRWEHPGRGMLLPDEFIRLAEDSGLIVPLGRWVLREACAEAMRWHTDGQALQVCVNLSARQLWEPGIIDHVAEALWASGLPPERLLLEITESAVLEEHQPTLQQLEAVHRLGVQLAVDDFGQGYSALSYLRRLPLDTLKIDKSFVSGLGDRPEDRSIVRFLVALSHELGVLVTAEGIERGEQLEQLRLLGCDHAQGFFLYEPLAAAPLEELLHAPPPPRRPAGPQSRQLGAGAAPSSAQAG